MGNENGTWIMHGVGWDDPACIHTAGEAVEYIEKVGFLPLFRNGIPGLSLEEHTVSAFWWSEDPGHDPWEWREVIARSGRVAYGKFFDRKAGFVSKEWFPVFANFRRDGYDFDALWEDEKASYRQKKIMDWFLGENEEAENLSNELKQKAGFGKGGTKGYEDTVTSLQMQTYLISCDFRRRRNKKGKEYGWPIAVYSTPEHLWGREFVTSAYGEAEELSGQRIIRHLKELFPSVRTELFKTVLGRTADNEEEA